MSRTHASRRSHRTGRGRTLALCAAVASALFGIAVTNEAPIRDLSEPAAVVAAGSEITAAAPVLGATAPAAASIGRAIQTAGAQAAREDALQLAVADAEAERHAQRAAEERRDFRREREEAAARANEQQASASSANTAGAATGNSVWDRLAQCESSGNWAHSGGRYHGGLQFHPQTWAAYKSAGMPAFAYQASRTQQVAVAERVKASQGWGAWPACARKLGLR